MNITRRGFLQGAIGLAGAGMTTALAVPALKTLLPPPVTRCNDDDAHETLTYKSESGKWYENMGGSVAKKEDFNLWNKLQESMALVGQLATLIAVLQSANN